MTSALDSILHRIESLAGRELNDRETFLARISDTHPLDTDTYYQLVRDIAQLGQSAYLLTSDQVMSRRGLRTDIAHLLGAMHHTLRLADRIHDTDTRETLLWIDAAIGDDTYIAPTSLRSITYLMTGEGLAPSDVHLSISSDANIQENLTLMADTPLGVRRANIHDRFRKVEVRIGSGSSVSHGVRLIGRSHDTTTPLYTVDLSLGDSVFIGIGATIGSGVRIEDRAAVWIGAQIGHGVTIGRSSLIGTSARIDADTVLDPYSLIVTGAHIAPDFREKFRTVPCHEYIAHRRRYDTEWIGPDGLRDFVVILSEDPETREHELQTLSPDYVAMTRFNETVVADNVQFACMMTVLSTVSRTVGYPLTDHISFMTTRTAEEIVNRSRGYYTIEHAMSLVSRPASLTITGLPATVDDFFERILPEIAERMLQDRDSVAEYLTSVLIRPEIDTPSRLCVGDVVLSGLGQYSGNTILIDYTARLDELSKGQICAISDSLLSGVLHGNGSKKYERTVAWGILHDSASVRDSLIGTPNDPVIIHGATIVRSTVGGGFVGSNVSMKHVQVGSHVICSSAGQITIANTHIDSGSIIARSETVMGEGLLRRYDE